MRIGVLIIILAIVVASTSTASAKEPSGGPFIELMNMIEGLQNIVENTPPPEDGISCWDLNGNGEPDPEEDINGDGVVNVSDCQGPPGADGADGADGAPGADGADGASGADGVDGSDGVACWDLNENGIGDIPEEDINNDGIVNVSDCSCPCWDLNGNGTGDIPEEDINNDGIVNVFDCQPTLIVSKTGGGQPHTNMQPYLGVYHVIALQGLFPSRNSEPFIGEIRTVGFNFAPRGWAFCDGQLLPISQNTALFSLLGTAYGGDGRTTFGLPDLRGRVAIHPGNGPGVNSVSWGQEGGANYVTLNVNQIPSHNHTVTRK